jgi:hypothetical protein
MSNSPFSFKRSHETPPLEPKSDTREPIETSYSSPRAIFSSTPFFHHKKKDRVLQQLGRESTMHKDGDEVVHSSESSQKETESASTQTGLFGLGALPKLLHPQIPSIPGLHAPHLNMTQIIPRLSSARTLFVNEAKEDHDDDVDASDHTNVHLAKSKRFELENDLLLNGTMFSLLAWSFLFIYRFALYVTGKLGFVCIRCISPFI